GRDVSRCRLPSGRRLDSREDARGFGAAAVTSLDIVAPIALCVLAAAAVGAVVAGIVLRRQQMLVEALRETRERLVALDEISEVWQWQTDAAHRLVALRPPAATRRPADGFAASCPFWECFVASGSGAVAARNQNAP